MCTEKGLLWRVQLCGGLWCTQLLFFFVNVTTSLCHVIQARHDSVVPVTAAFGLLYLSYSTTGFAATLELQAAITFC
jgi:hypothetical protein